MENISHTLALKQIIEFVLQLNKKSKTLKSEYHSCEDSNERKKLRSSLESTSALMRSSLLKLLLNYESDILCRNSFHMSVDVFMWKTCFYTHIEQYRSGISKTKKNLDSDIIMSKEKEKMQAHLAKLATSLLKILGDATAFYSDTLIKLETLRRKQIQSQRNFTTTNATHGKNNSCHNGNNIYKQRMFQSLIYLGDIQRYRVAASQATTTTTTTTTISNNNLNTSDNNNNKLPDYREAESYYLRASNLHPSQGNPHNQLAVIAQLQGENESFTAFYRYCRALMSVQPFRTAFPNMDLLCNKLGDITRIVEQGMLRTITTPTNGSSNQKRSGYKHNNSNNNNSNYNTKNGSGKSNNHSNSHSNDSSSSDQISSVHSFFNGFMALHMQLHAWAGITTMAHIANSTHTSDERKASTNTGAIGTGLHSSTPGGRLAQRAFVPIHEQNHRVDSFIRCMDDNLQLFKELLNKSKLSDTVLYRMVSVCIYSVHIQDPTLADFMVKPSENKDKNNSASSHEKSNSNSGRSSSGSSSDSSSGSSNLHNWRCSGRNECLNESLALSFLFKIVSCIARRLIDLKPERLVRGTSECRVLLPALVVFSDWGRTHPMFMKSWKFSDLTTSRNNITSIDNNNINDFNNNSTTTSSAANRSGNGNGGVDVDAESNEVDKVRDTQDTVSSIGNSSALLLSRPATATTTATLNVNVNALNKQDHELDNRGEITPMGRLNVNTFTMATTLEHRARQRLRAFFTELKNKITEHAEHIDLASSSNSNYNNNQRGDSNSDNSNSKSDKYLREHIILRGFLPLMYAHQQVFKPTTTTNVTTSSISIDDSFLNMEFSGKEQLEESNALLVRLAIIVKFVQESLIPSNVTNLNSNPIPVSSGPEIDQEMIRTYAIKHGSLYQNTDQGIQSNNINYNNNCNDNNCNDDNNNNNTSNFHDDADDDDQIKKKNKPSNVMEGSRPVITTNANPSSLLASAHTSRSFTDLLAHARSSSSSASSPALDSGVSGVSGATATTITASLPGTATTPSTNTTNTTATATTYASISSSMGASGSSLNNLGYDNMSNETLMDVQDDNADTTTHTAVHINFKVEGKEVASATSAQHVGPEINTEVDTDDDDHQQPLLSRQQELRQVHGVSTVMDEGDSSDDDQDEIIVFKPRLPRHMDIGTADYLKLNVHPTVSTTTSFNTMTSITNVSDSENLYCNNNSNNNDDNNNNDNNNGSNNNSNCNNHDDVNVSMLTSSNTNIHDGGTIELPYEGPPPSIGSSNDNPNPSDYIQMTHRPSLQESHLHQQRYQLIHQQYQLHQQYQQQQQQQQQQMVSNFGLPVGLIGNVPWYSPPSSFSMSSNSHSMYSVPANHIAHANPIVPPAPIPEAPTILELSTGGSWSFGPTPSSQTQPDGPPGLSG